MYMIDYKKELEDTASALGVLGIAAEILNDPAFLLCSGSHWHKAHHYGKGGLLQHTWEVCSIVLSTATFYLEKHPNIDRVELFLSALFHDYGKVWDYVRDPKTGEYSTNPNKHKRRIHHIQRSAIEWEMIARKHCFYEKLTERITHNILSHHGQRDWGSPVAPLTREAWILHLADSMSARVDDCDRIDLAALKGK